MTHKHQDCNHDMEKELTLDEKLLKLLEYWVNHNDDHAKSYMVWAEKIQNKEIFSLLKDAVDLTIDINKKFETAILKLKNNISN